MDYSIKELSHDMGRHGLIYCIYTNLKKGMLFHKNLNVSWFNLPKIILKCK